jgi:hypothetical protein
MSDFYLIWQRKTWMISLKNCGGPPMILAIDINVLLDILIPNAAFAQRSLKCLESLSSEDELIISPVVFAELASQFPSEQDLETFLRNTGIQMVSLSRAALYEASKTWKVYTAGKSGGILCQNCGHRQRIKCAKCKGIIVCCQHILSDFLIGAHAKVHADRLVTRDRGYYRTYFKDLILQTP